MERNAKGRFFEGFTPWNKGKKLSYAGHTKPHTEESKRKMSEARKGKKTGPMPPFSDDHRKKISMALRGRKLDLKHRENIKIAMQRFRGENNPHWKGGKCERNKYILVICPLEFQNMSKKDGYIMEHRLVMARVLGRPLLKNEVVDHINRDTRDNRPENLRVYENNGKHLADTLRKDNPQRLLQIKKK